MCILIFTSVMLLLLYCFFVQDSYLNFRIEWAVIGTNFDTDFIVRGASGVGLKSHSVLRRSLRSLLWKHCCPWIEQNSLNWQNILNSPSLEAWRKEKFVWYIINYLCEEELVSVEELEEASATALRQLELEERAKEREAQVKVKELQQREKELEVWLRMRELANY